MRLVQTISTLHSGPIDKAGRVRVAFRPRPWHAIPPLVAMAPALRIAVVGAGSAGLAAAQQFRAVANAYHQTIDLVVFERRSSVGGLWQYESDPGHCDIHVPYRGTAGYATRPGRDPMCRSAMYEDLRTNIPSVCDEPLT